MHEQNQKENSAASPSYKPIASDCVKAEARRLGFALCGMAPAEPVDARYADAYRRWLEEGRHADMHYLENHFDKRMDPRLLVEGTRTVISLAFNYFPNEVAEGIAWYAQGRDYHDLLRERMTQLMETIGLHGRCFVDTAPVPERYWAWRCGLGWIGKHSQLVVPHIGSTFFLGELFVQEEMDAYDSPMPNHCGRCSKCIDACPMGAITEPQLLEGGVLGPESHCFDSRRCLSYLTIENRGDIPAEAKAMMSDTFYGCDRCTKACPHLHGTPTAEPQFRPSQELLSMTPTDWQQLTPEQYQSLFKGSAVKRAKYDGLMRNIKSRFSSDG